MPHGQTAKLIFPSKEVDLDKCNQPEQGRKMKTHFGELTLGRRNWSVNSILQTCKKKKTVS